MPFFRERDLTRDIYSGAGSLQENKVWTEGHLRLLKEGWKNDLFCLKNDLSWFSALLLHKTAEEQVTIASYSLG